MSWPPDKMRIGDLIQQSDHIFVHTKVTYGGKIVEIDPLEMTTMEMLNLSEGVQFAFIIIERYTTRLTQGPFYSFNPSTSEYTKHSTLDAAIMASVFKSADLRQPTGPACPTGAPGTVSSSRTPYGRPGWWQSPKGKKP